ncbi:hypothetical protein BTUL_0104g00070 [Botrytis tulipae]|uniref:Uncharacterized protein n=1 Tax=Botrytis tulipae TaxID=87230 RepID=A0A4Z1EL95_9HELO|nr:hypothetical protein BTUL_0104g00070 [Botrytis tulipae]
MSVLFSSQKALGADILLAINADLWRPMPGESAEQLFTILTMKTQSQGVSTTLVPALDSKLAGKYSCIMRICETQGPLA